MKFFLMLIIFVLCEDLFCASRKALSPQPSDFVIEGLEYDEGALAPFFERLFRFTHGEYTIFDDGIAAFIEHEQRGAVPLVSSETVSLGALLGALPQVVACPQPRQRPPLPPKKGVTRENVFYNKCLELGANDCVKNHFIYALSKGISVIFLEREFAALNVPVNGPFLTTKAFFKFYKAVFKYEWDLKECTHEYKFVEVLDNLAIPTNVLLCRFLIDVFYDSINYQNRSFDLAKAMRLLSTRFDTTTLFASY